MTHAFTSYDFFCRSKSFAGTVRVDKLVLRIFSGFVGFKVLDGKINCCTPRQIFI